MPILPPAHPLGGGLEGRTDGSVTMSLRNFIGEGIIKYKRNIVEITLRGTLGILV